MVYFNCEKCGTGLRKNQVDAHMNQCRAGAVSCNDCQKSFFGTEFKAHVSCLTESQRYESKSSYVAKANKGELKQASWFEKVASAVETFRGSARAKALLEKLVEYPNIPRKKAKFYNFTRNSFYSYGVNESLLDEVWAVIEKINVTPPPTPPTKPAPPTSAPGKRNSPEETEEEKENSNKKVKTGDEKKDDEKKQTFDWFEMIKHELEKREDKQCELAKLTKKVYKKYSKVYEEQEDQVKFSKKMDKKLKKYKESFVLNLTSDKSTSYVQYLEPTA